MAFGERLQEARKRSGFTQEDYSETGLWLLDTLKRYGGR